MIAAQRCRRIFAEICAEMRMRTCVGLAHARPAPSQVHALGRMAPPATPDDANVRDAISAYAACEKVRRARSYLWTTTALCPPP